jgi:hypothetical protein
MEDCGVIRHSSFVTTTITITIMTTTRIPGRAARQLRRDRRHRECDLNASPPIPAWSTAAMRLRPLSFA